jgi:hypothetical protein
MMTITVFAHLAPASRVECITQRTDSEPAEHAVLQFGAIAVFPAGADQLRRIRGVIDAWLETNTQAPAAIC